MAKFLITGAAGYIGSILIPRLLNAGHEVVALDTFVRGDTTLAAVCADEKFSVVKGDTRDEALIKPLVAKADVIIPLAAMVGAPICKQDPISAQSINSDAVRKIVSLTSANQILIYPNTNSGYGIGEKDQYCTEETPLNPISLYGTSKCEAENAVLDSGHGVTLRLATVFGMSPRMRIDLLVNDFVWRATTDRAATIFEGHFKRNYIHVRDVAKAFQHAFENFDAMKSNAYNVGLSDANLSKLELCAKIKEHIPAFVYLEAPIGEDPDKRDYIVSNEKIEKAGFKPEWSLDRGIKELMTGYKMLRNSRYSNV
ncbi:MAG TPA: NAD(P)-dependent oxidoreductase [Asticcacaulis sp.]|nr:NAD(P)-dependent oxidoreductase [Asticcacaulis sp.]